jgi:hypothetical protein
MVDSRSLGGATAPGLGIIVIAQRERERERVEEVVGVLTNGVT